MEGNQIGWELPYYAVIFTSVKSKLGHNSDYDEMAEKMVKLASTQNGFLGLDSARNEVGVTVSYWKDLAAIRAWRQNLEHLEAQSMGKEKWYKCYTVRVAKVEREYSLRSAKSNL
jgi:heme-degrading monooxygenase HmoA